MARPARPLSDSRTISGYRTVRDCGNTFGVGRGTVLHLGELFSGWLVSERPRNCGQQRVYRFADGCRGYVRRLSSRASVRRDRGGDLPEVVSLPPKPALRRLCAAACPRSAGTWSPAITHRLSPLVSL